MPRSLSETLKALYESEINVTITTLWDGGYDLALCSFLEWDTPSYKPRNVRNVDQIADTLHEMALAELPESDYSKKAG